MSIIKRMHPEARIDGFTHLDGSVVFFGFVRACMLRLEATKVLDFGAGRGKFFYTNTRKDGSLYRKHLHAMRGEGVHVTAADVDPVVESHPCSDAQQIIEIGQPLPFEDNSFDVIVSDMTFEHVADPEIVAPELLRVVRPGGYICARTPAKYGYVALISSLVPNRLHTAVLKYAQPNRKAEDVFPTVYELNTPGQIKRHFPGCEVMHFYSASEPGYYFGNGLLYRFLQGVHAILPPPLRPTICIFIRKPGGARDDDA